jgi:hypothetical protein
MSEEPEPKKARTEADPATASIDNLQSLRYSNEGGSQPKLEVLDQLLVPHEKVYIPVPDITTAWTVIQTMQIRGSYVCVCVREREREMIFDTYRASTNDAFLRYFQAPR